ncbi:MAG TPA: TonB-dependent receptor, partial [Rhizomicrobium sp.]|nr:TonB-dependent receptor [Rhizomicrobium sp.]
MLNLPIVDDRVSIRLAGEWTKRQGYSYNSVTEKRIDGRDLWSGRITVGWKPAENLQTYLIWEHFSENDDRIRSAKQLCKTDTPPETINGVTVPKTEFTAGGNGAFGVGQGMVSQGCKATSLYAPEAFQVPYAYALPYLTAAGVAGAIKPDANPYANTIQSTNLRVIESALNPTYRAKNDTVEFLADYALSPSLMFTSQTGFNQDSMYSTQDFNRFNTQPGIFIPTAKKKDMISDDGVFCDPQLGCSDRLVAMDMSYEHAWQFNQEVRLTTNFSSAFNFSLGANYLHYETKENYYVFFNTLSIYTLSNNGGANAVLANTPYVPGVTDHHECLTGTNTKSGYRLPIPSQGGGIPTQTCIYMDPNPVTSLNDQGHNYFLSQNPYTLNSYAAFGEANYDVLDDVKVTAGLRYTKDRKHFTNFPSELIAQGYGYPSTGVVNQNWDQFTGRLVANWSPKLDFTDQTLVYGSFAHGYKAGGANPPGAVLLTYASDGSTVGNPIHPLTFKPEFIDAFELGTKNKLLDGALTFNASAFYYDYKAYQISEIVDRTSINLNFDATVRGIELESTYEPMPGLRFNFAGGWQKTRIADGMKAVDLMDRTAGNSDWMVMKPFVTQASNCVMPKYVVAQLMAIPFSGQGNPGAAACGYAYNLHVDPVTLKAYDPANKLDHLNNPIPNYPGYNPLTAPNNGEGFDKDLGGNALPNAPPLTLSAGAQYSMPLTSSWAGTLRADYYWQDYSWARVFNDNPYDRLRGYSTVNLAVILTSQNGWQVMLYDKNVFSATAITGTFLNSDDSGLTTNVFLTDPKLIGIRLTKNW